jgi:hypothetical protein
MDPSEMIRTLGSLASMVSAYLAIGREQHELTQQDRNRILQAGDIGAQRIPIEEYIRVLSGVPKDILDGYNDRIIRSRQDYEWGVKHLNPIDLEKLRRNTQFEICSFLRLLQRHNGGAFPTPDDHQLWKAFECDDFVADMP